VPSARTSNPVLGLREKTSAGGAAGIVSVSVMGASNLAENRDAL
jgi:hypothetical protein